MLAYNNPKVIEESLKRFEEQTDLNGLSCVAYGLFDAQYPMPDIESNGEKVKLLCERYGWGYERLEKNEGQNGNLNTIFNKLKDCAAPQDLIAFWEPDSSVVQSNWLKACFEVTDGTDVGFVTPHRLPEWVLNNQGAEVVVNGHRAREICWPGGFPMGIYTYDFIEKMQALFVSHEYYGGTEGNILQALRETKKRGLMFCDIEDRVDASNFDPEYIAWKHETIVQPKGQQKDFTEWLKLKGYQK